MQVIIAIARFTWLEMRRNRSAWLVLGVIAAALAAALFAADLALTASASYRAGIYAASARLALVLVTILLVATSVLREQDDRRLELTLSRPVSRSHWFIGRLLGFMTLAMAIAGSATLPALVLSAPGAALLWGVSLAAELCLIAAASLTAAITFRQVAATVVAVSAFYLLARAMSAIVLMSQGPAIDPTALSNRLIGFMVQALALLLPRLDRFTESAWLFSQSAPALSTILLEAVVYIGLLAAIGLIDLARRNDA